MEPFNSIGCVGYFVNFFTSKVRLKRRSCSSESVRPKLYEEDEAFSRQMEEGQALELESIGL
jgi:hypothetical protein